MPRILFVSPHPPHGLSYGSQLRALHISRILRGCGELGMVLMPYGKIDDETLQKVRNEFDLRAVLFFDKPFPNTIGSLMRREFDPYCTETHGGGLGSGSVAIFEEIVKEYDLIWFHGIRVANCVNRKSWPCSILDIDDVQSQVYAGRAKQAENWVSRLRSVHQVILWRRREKVLLNRFGIVCVCSENDKQYLGGDSRIHAVPNGFEAPMTAPQRMPLSPPQVGFIGTLRYAPNVDGLRWFIREVWPLIKASRSDARLRLVGLDTDAGIAAEGPDIDGLGFVDDVAAEISGWSTSIVPINVGGGTRIKIAEAFSRKCPVVSSRLGAYGYEIESGRECLLADTPAEMATACLRLIDDLEYGNALAERAWKRFGDEWSWNAISPRVHRAVSACLACTPESRT